MTASALVAFVDCFNYTKSKLVDFFNVSFMHTHTETRRHRDSKRTTHTHTHKRTYTRTHTHTQIHTYMHAHVHTCKSSVRQNLTQRAKLVFVCYYQRPHFRCCFHKRPRPGGVDFGGLQGRGCGGARSRGRGGEE